MKRFGFWIVLAAAFILYVALSCSEERPANRGCDQIAIVRNLQGLDGCGYAFELPDGRKVIPYWEFGWCGTPPLPKEVTEDPLYNFQFVEGKKVLIGFQERKDVASTCMSGEMVKVTCLQEISEEEKK